MLTHALSSLPAYAISVLYRNMSMKARAHADVHISVQIHTLADGRADSSIDGCKLLFLANDRKRSLVE